MKTLNKCLKKPSQQKMHKKQSRFHLCRVPIDDDDGAPGSQLSVDRFGSAMSTSGVGCDDSQDTAARTDNSFLHLFHGLSGQLCR